MGYIPLLGPLREVSRLWHSDFLQDYLSITGPVHNTQFMQRCSVFNILKILTAMDSLNHFKYLQT